MDINDTYDQLKTLQLTTSQRHFSEHFLSRSPSHLSMLNATKRRPSLNTLIRLSHRLSEVAASAKNPTAEWLTSLSEDVLSAALKN